MSPSALVTGSANGIGRALAVALARRGYALTVSRGASGAALSNSTVAHAVIHKVTTRSAHMDERCPVPFPRVTCMSLHATLTRQPRPDLASCIPLCSYSCHSSHSSQLLDIDERGLRETVGADASGI